MRRNMNSDEELKRKTFKELRNLNCIPKILIDQHLFVEVRKVNTSEQVQEMLYGGSE